MICKTRLKFLIGACLIIIIVWISGKNIDFSIIGKNHFNVITVNTVLLGFLFTALSILLGFANEAIMKYLEGSNIMKNIFDTIINGIFIGVLGIVLSLVNIIIFPESPPYEWYANYLFSIEIVLVILVLIKFVKAVLYVKNIIDTNNEMKEKNKKEENINKDFKRHLSRGSNN